ncbi:uncharacterized protein [Drosophila tropicalis]|uniref:uncharacterized protein n=1 Tax=Drosophila tropicalis TaxID=46794 RepID=UPI0035ABCDA9
MRPVASDVQQRREYHQRRFKRATKMRKFLHLNLNHCEAVHDLPAQNECEVKAELAIISESFRKKSTGIWVASTSGKAALWSCGASPIKLRHPMAGEYFVRAQADGKWVYSCRRDEHVASRYHVPVTTDKVLAAARSLKQNKAPGPDSIPNRALRLAMATRPEIFAATFNQCLKEAVFPSQCKLQKLVLLPKPGKPAEVASSYRPICLVDSVGKVLESLISARLSEAISAGGGLSANQRAKEYYLVITLDVKNAFNTADWGCILDAARSFRIPSYLYEVLSGHGCFRQAIDDAHHVVFSCGRFGVDRQRAERAIGQSLSEASLVPSMLESKDKWAAVSAYIGVIMRELRRLERERVGSA